MTDPLSADLASLRIDRSGLRTADEAPAQGSEENRAIRGKPGARRAATALVVVGVLGGAAAAFAPRLKAIAIRPEVATTAIAVVSPRSADVSLTSSGYVVAQRTSRVGALVMGAVTRVAVSEGDMVKKGDLLAVLDERDSRAQLATAAARATAVAARADTASAQLRELAVQADRDGRLMASGAIPTAQFTDLEARRASAERAALAARAEANAAKADLVPLTTTLSEHTVVAPIPGIVFSKPIQVGEIASPGGRPVAEIFDPESLVVETDVPEARLSLARPGSPCEVVLDAYPNKRFRCITTEIGHKVDRAKATITVKAKFVDLAEGVIPDMAARTSFLSQPLTDEEKAAKPKKVVAADAIVDRAGKKVVFVVDGDHVRATPVTPGEATGSVVELLNGPAAGVKVVAAPPAALEDDQTIKERGN